MEEKTNAQRDFSWLRKVARPVALRQPHKGAMDNGLRRGGQKH